MFPVQGSATALAAQTRHREPVPVADYKVHVPTLFSPF